jgi:hypothetical protein
MDLLWTLLIVILALLLYTAVQILRFAGRTCRNSALRRTQNPPIPAPKRPLRWISLEDCPSILAATQDPLIIDLRPRLHRHIAEAGARSRPERREPGSRL